MIEQLRMRGRVASEAEVAGRADDRSAEMVHPDSVDQHASRQWIFGRGDRTRQFQSAGAFGERLPVLAGDHLEESPRHLFARRPGIASAVDAWVKWLFGIFEDHRPRG